MVCYYSITFFILVLGLGLGFGKTWLVRLICSKITSAVDGKRMGLGCCIANTVKDELYNAVLPASYFDGWAFNRER